MRTQPSAHALRTQYTYIIGRRINQPHQLSNRRDPAGKGQPSCCPYATARDESVAVR